MNLLNIHQSKLAKTFLSFLIVCAFALSAAAQFDTATVLGAIRDPNGAAIEGANVTLKNIATGINATATTDSNGDYQFTGVKIGIYQVIVEAGGFNKTIADKVEVTVNARQRVDLALQVASASATVVVTDAASPLQTDSSEVGQVVQRRQIVALPLNGRSYANLALLAPGVRESSTNSSIGGGGREAAFNVNGLRATFNNFCSTALTIMLTEQATRVFRVRSCRFRRMPSPSLKCRRILIARNMGVRARGHQRFISQRDKRFSRNIVGISPQHSSKRRRIFQAGRRS